MDITSKMAPARNAVKVTNWDAMKLNVLHLVQFSSMANVNYATKNNHTDALKNDVLQWMQLTIFTIHVINVLKQIIKHAIHKIA